MVDNKYDMEITTWYSLF